MTAPATNPTAPVEEPKLDFAAAAAEVWKENAPPVQETIQTSAGEPDEKQPDNEEKAPPAEVTKEERIGGRIAAAKRAELAAAKERDAAKAEKAALEARARELEAREKRLRILEEDPVKAFEELKLDPKTFLEKLSGEYKPENVATKEVAALRQQLEELKERDAKRDAEAKTAAQRAQMDSAWKDASDAFIAFIGESTEKYPSLVEEFSEKEATELAFKELTAVVGHDAEGRPITRTQAYFAEHGEYPDNDVIAEHLDKLAKQRIEGRAKSGWRSRGESAPGSKPSPGDQKPVPPVSGMSPRTLRARDASTRAAPPKVWTQEAADEESIRLIQAAMRKQA